MSNHSRILLIRSQMTQASRTPPKHVNRRAQVLLAYITHRHDVARHRVHMRTQQIVTPCVLFEVLDERQQTGGVFADWTGGELVAFGDGRDENYREFAGCLVVTPRKELCAQRWDESIYVGLHVGHSSEDEVDVYVVDGHFGEGLDC